MVTPLKRLLPAHNPPHFQKLVDLGSGCMLFLVLLFFFISVHKEGAVACGDAGDQDTSSSV